MADIRRSISVLFLVIILIACIAGVGSAQTLLPWVIFNGKYYVTAGIGTGSLTLNASVSQMYYEDGTILKQNVTGLESIWGAKVVLTNAIRTGDYSFNGDPSDPDDVYFSIVSPDGFVYFTSSIADSEFVMVPTPFSYDYFWLNKDLDANDPATLNLYNIELNTDEIHPSKYIQQLSAYLGASNASGMKMQLRVPKTSDFTTNSSGTIQYGLIDGLQSLNVPPLANAGDNVSVSSYMAASTVINGKVMDGNTGDVLECRWLKNGEAVTLWSNAGNDGACPLYLSSIAFDTGTYTMTLEVSDGELTSSDEMILTVENSAPNAVAGGGGTYEIGSTIRLTGDLSDYDGDDLTYEWKEGDTVLCPPGSIASIAGGTPVIPDDCVVTGMGLGVHEIVLQVNDGENATVSSNTVSVEISDSTAPTVAPIASNYILWPPNHIMVNIAIAANAADNSGQPVVLSASVSSNEPEDGLGDGDTGPYDYSDVSVVNGILYLQLRAERSGSGSGRTYTVTVSATDGSGNITTTPVEIKVPHNMAKKK